jgi:hypothetical protein
VQPAAVVEDFDVLVDRCGGFVPGRPAAPIEQLALERAEEALDAGVVQQLPLPLMLHAMPWPRSATW